MDIVQSVNPAVAAGALSLVSVVAVQLFTEKNPIGRVLLFWKQLGAHERSLSSSSTVSKGIDDYNKLHANDCTAEERNSKYQTLVNAYYDLATVFYEWGWSKSFHFAFRFPHEDFLESIRRHEYLVAARLNVYGEEKHVLDVGCGIGGPMRNIAKFLQCKITGITINPYQVKRGNELHKNDPLVSDKCNSLYGDFMALPFSEGEFDAAYAIEATCHAPDRVKCYSEIYRVLKPGGVFACYEWCLTDKFNPKDPKHLKMKKGIEEGTGLSDIVHTHVCLEALRQAGFEVLTDADLSKVPLVHKWYSPLMPTWNPFDFRFQFNWLGTILINVTIKTMEFLWIAPAGTVKTHKVLQTGGMALRDAGQDGMFTAMYLLVGRKPLK